MSNINTQANTHFDTRHKGSQMTDFTVEVLKEGDLTLEQWLSKEKSWPDNATCATQESDGLVIYWNETVDKVVKARKEANVLSGLIPILGNSKIAHITYTTKDGQNYLCNDWLVSVFVPKVSSDEL